MKNIFFGYCSLLLLLVINTANAAPYAYLNAGNSVAVVDVETMTEVQRINVGRRLGHLDVRPGGNYVYGVIGARNTIGAYDPKDREITVIDIHDYSVKPAIKIPESILGAFLLQVTSSPDGTRIYAIDNKNYLYFIDAQTHDILHSVQIDDPEYLLGDVSDIDVLADNSAVMVAYQGRFVFYDTQSYADIGGGNYPFHGSGVKSVRANPRPSRDINGTLVTHQYFSCGTDSIKGYSTCVVSSDQRSEDGRYDVNTILMSSAELPDGFNTVYTRIANSYDGRNTFLNTYRGNIDNKYAAIHVFQAGQTVLRSGATIEFPINTAIPINLDAHPSKDQLFVYTNHGELYKVSYQWVEDWPFTQEKLQISNGGGAVGHFIGGPMPLIASIKPGDTPLPHLPVNTVSQKVFSFHNHLNLKPVSLQCTLDNGQAFSLSGGDVNVSLQSDETAEVTVNFSAAVAGQYTDTLRCSDSNNGEFVYSLEGNYVTPVTATPASGSLVVLPTQWPATGATYQTINFQNPNLTPANVSCSISDINGVFSAADSLTVPASGNANLRVNLDSANAGIFDGTLNCSSDVGGAYVYDLSGETITPLVAQPIVPGSVNGALDMGYVYPLQSALQRTLSFENVNVSSLGFSCQLASDDSGFTLEPVPGQVAAGGMVDVTVTYRSDAPALETLARLDCGDETGQQWTHYFRANALMPINATPAKNSNVILPPQRVGTAPTSASFTLSNLENVVDGFYFACTTHLLTPPFVGYTQTLEMLPLGGEKRFDVEFDSATAGDYTTTLDCWILHEGIGYETAEIIEYTLKASAFYTLTSSPRSGSTINLPDVSIDPEATSAPAGEELTRATNAAISFQNHAPADESLSCSLNGGSVFSVNAMPMTIPANSSATLNVTFNPVTPGEYTDTLSCSGASGDLFSFTLQGRGVEAPPRRTEMELPLSEGPHSGKMLHLAVTDSEWNLDAAQTLTAASLGTALPQGVMLPHGALSLRLTEGTPGSSSTIVLTYPFALPAGTRYYKYGPTADNPADHWYPYDGAVISGNTITLTLTDGGAGDSDLSVNGIIDDPGGPVLLAADLAPIPTLSQWAMLLLAGIIGLLALNRVRWMHNT
ncbi:IPTL-CTERM sorting domain-containing protein [Halopseudomonas salegens]|nr:IPTL-CTERM sorting domain-containing protein [Halopseudomonas salegens]